MRRAWLDVHAFHVIAALVPALVESAGSTSGSAGSKSRFEPAVTLIKAVSAQSKSSG